MLYLRIINYVEYESLNDAYYSISCILLTHERFRIADLCTWNVRYNIRHTATISTQNINHNCYEYVTLRNRNKSIDCRGNRYGSVMRYDYEFMYTITQNKNPLNLKTEGVSNLQLFENFVLNGCSLSFHPL